VIHTSSRLIRQLLAAGREVRTLVWTPTRAAAVRMTMDTAGVQPDLSFVAEAHRNDAERLDAVAGSEFLDDRIRLRG
jgi:hypothetical protein